MVKKVSPGLSSMGETPDMAFEYLRPLLSFASDNIPEDKHKVLAMTSAPENTVISFEQFLKRFNPCSFEQSYIG